jgi:hypothetical protein
VGVSTDRPVPEHSSSLCGIVLNSAAIEFVRFAAVSPSHIGQVIKKTPLSRLASIKNDRATSERAGLVMFEFQF